MKLGTKLPLFYSVLIALLGAAFIAFTSTQVEQRMVEEEREYFETLAKTFTQNTANAIVLRDYAALSLFVDNLSQGEHVRYAAILDEEGNVLAHTRHHLEGSPLADPVSLKAAAAQQLLMQPSGGDVVDVAAPLLIAGRKWGAVRIGFSVREMKRKVAQARLTILSAGLIAIALGAAAAGASTPPAKTMLPRRRWKSPAETLRAVAISAIATTAITISALRDVMSVLLLDADFADSRR